ncbi:hypothetical protein [Moorena producens]|uniref:hypothetical protein n=1 Tax=Moorena producens TaxID=1155739 RepID=UPI0011EA69B4|nr:hypothetical protein [Moorena producens]
MSTKKYFFSLLFLGKQSAFSNQLSAISFWIWVVKSSIAEKGKRQEAKGKRDPEFYWTETKRPYRFKAR